MYTLYYSPGACSMAVHVALNEVNQPFELVNVSISEGKNREADYLKINPRGNVPALGYEHGLLREGGAILTYLLDNHKSPLLPSEGKARAEALEWLMYCNATLHPAYSRIFFINKQCQDATAKEQLLKSATEVVNKMWAELDARLAQNAYLCGKECTIADILMAVIANWGAWLPYPVTFGPNVKRVLKEVSARPAYQKALAAEKVEYKAAA